MTSSVQDKLAFTDMSLVYHSYIKDTSALSTVMAIILEAAEPTNY